MKSETRRVGAAAAMFVDYDNLCRGLGDDDVLDPCPSGFVPWGLIVRAIEDDFLPVTIRRAYGDFLLITRGIFRERVYNSAEIRGRIDQDICMHEHLMGLGFEMLFSPPMGRDTKNRVDMQIGLDAMEVAHAYRSVQHFVFVTGDSDFSPVVQRLKALGKTVSVIAVEDSLSGLLRSLADSVLLVDRRLVDRYLRTPLTSIVAGWLATPATRARLNAGGIDSSALVTGLAERVPGLACADFGYRAWAPLLENVFDDMVWKTEDGKEVTLVLSKSMIRCRQPVAAAPAAPPAEAPAELPSKSPPRDDRQERAEVLLKALNTRQSNPHPELRQKLVGWLREKLGGGSVTTYRALQEAAFEGMSKAERTKSAHVMKALRLGGLLLGEGGRAIEFSSAGSWDVEQMFRLEPDSSVARAHLVELYVAELRKSAELGDQPVGMDDAPLIAAVIFGASRGDDGAPLVRRALEGPGTEPVADEASQRGSPRIGEIPGAG